MEQPKLRGETDHCRNRLLKYCHGQGLDLGCGAVKIKPDAIGIDLRSPYADMNRDARLLDYYKSGIFDFVFSSHLLEEIQDTEATLKEWLRLLKDGGYIVLYQADKDLYYPIGDPRCNGAHKHHFNWESLWTIFQGIGGVELVHHGRHPENDEWSFELVVKKTSNEKPTALLLEGISILVPTLNRPKGIEDFAISVDATAEDHSSLEIVFGIHEEDTASKAKIEELDKTLKMRVRAEIIARHPEGKVNLSFLWNQLYARSKYPIVGYFGDDVVYRTPGWDNEVRKEFAKDKTILLACNDVHVQRGKQATLFFTHKTVHDRVGYYLKPEFRRWWMDTFWEVVYRNAGKLKYREDLVTEHFHPDVFPERLDDTYKNMDGLKDRDRTLWDSQTIRDEIVRCTDILKGVSKQKQVISFSLYGDKPQYCLGAVENAKLAPQIYPGWICRFYVDETVPENCVNELKKLGAEIVMMSDPLMGIDQRKMFWRFLTAGDPTVDRTIVRDCDSRLNVREKAAVDEWVASEVPFHIMRDHKQHTAVILGGMWGAEKGLLTNIKTLIHDWLSKHPTSMQGWYSDQHFLKECVWPLVNNCHIAHASNFFVTNTERKFPVELPLGYFVGQQYTEKNKPVFV